MRNALQFNFYTLLLNTVGVSFSKNVTDFIFALCIEMDWFIHN